jgi:hypothetical protein
MGETETLKVRWRRWLREPLLHFLIGGLLVFLLSLWRGEPVDPASRTIVITEAQVARIAASWEQSWRRQPTPREIDALIRDFIKDEIYYREALRLGLDGEDVVIRRRLRSKMEFLARAQVESAKPSDAVLQAWLDKYPARFASDSAFSFDQIYLGPTETADAPAMLKAVSRGADWETQGQSISLPRSLDKASQTEIERQFGAAFADALPALPKGAWAGPVASGFGSHLVRLRAAQASAKPKLADVRQAVENDWRAATMKEREAKAYQALLEGYDIEIKQP